jgi:hypothetical protein
MCVHCLLVNTLQAANFYQYFSQPNPQPAFDIQLAPELLAQLLPDLNRDLERWLLSEERKSSL